MPLYQLDPGYHRITRQRRSTISRTPARASHRLSRRENRRGSRGKRATRVERIARTRNVVRAIGRSVALARGCCRCCCSKKVNLRRRSRQRKTNASALLDFPDFTGPPLLLPRAPLAPPTSLARQRRSSLAAREAPITTPKPTRCARERQGKRSRASYGSPIGRCFSGLPRAVEAVARTRGIERPVT